MNFSKNEKLNLLVCEKCHGRGFAGWQKCRTCKGFSAVSQRRGLLLFFNANLDEYHIYLRIGRQWLDRFEYIGAFLIGLALTGIFVWKLYILKIADHALTQVFWLKPDGIYPLIFWLAVIAFTFFIYKMAVLDVSRPEVEKKGYGEDDSISEVNISLSWASAKKIARRKRKNIALTFSADAGKILQVAYMLAHRRRNYNVTALDIFLALLAHNSVIGIFTRLGISRNALREQVSRLAKKSDARQEPALADDFFQVVFNAYEYARAAHAPEVAPTELLVSAVRASEPVQELLYDLKVDAKKMSDVVEWERIRASLRRHFSDLRKAASRLSKYGMDKAMTAVATPYLNNFSQDLTLSAKHGYLVPCVGRDKEIAEIFRVIEGGRQNIILVGERGTGRETILQGIVQKSIAEDAPKRLLDKRFVQLSPSSLLAGTTVSGAQERLIRMLNEMTRARNVVLCINNVHELMQKSGDDGSQGIDVSETLAEYAKASDILILATTTPDGYNRHILNNQIGSIFARVDIREMSEDQAVQVLESRAGGIEYKHGVYFSYDAIAEAIKMSIRFLHEAPLPESAIELITEAAAQARNKKGENHLVTEDDVATVVGSKTGVPTVTISSNEGDRLLHLEAEMHKRVIGQDEAVSLVANALRRARTEIRSTKKPISTFLFVGPTGVGKTELAKTIAEVYFGGENRMIRFDMSEYQDKQAIYRLIGEPHKSGTGLLTEAVRQRPFSLVLLDEMEKADPDILNLFLQVFDDGRLTDSVGKVIDFTNTIIIATSNAGTSFVQERMDASDGLEKIRQALIHGELKKYYRPEFLNRFDGIVLFTYLDRIAIKKVAELMLARVAKDLEQRGVTLRIEDVALESIADIGFDQEFGARPMRRAIQDHVENKLAELVLSGKLKRRDTVVLGANAEIRVE